jgi:RNA-binding protein
MSLSNTQKKHLKGPAHHLKPAIWIGQKGLTEAVFAEIELALEHHELVKMKVKVGDRDDRHAAIEAICERTGAELITSIGATASVFRRNPKQSIIPLPQ